MKRSQSSEPPTEDKPLVASRPIRLERGDIATILGYVKAALGWPSGVKLLKEDGVSPFGEGDEVQPGALMRIYVGGGDSSSHGHHYFEYKYVDWATNVKEGGLRRFPGIREVDASDLEHLEQEITRMLGKKPDSLSLHRTPNTNTPRVEVGTKVMKGQTLVAYTESGEGARWWSARLLDGGFDVKPLRTDPKLVAKSIHFEQLEKLLSERMGKKPNTMVVRTPNRKEVIEGSEVPLDQPLSIWVGSGQGGRTRWTTSLSETGFATPKLVFHKPSTYDEGTATEQAARDYPSLRLSEAHRKGLGLRMGKRFKLPASVMGRLLRPLVASERRPVSFSHLLASLGLHGDTEVPPIYTESEAALLEEVRRWWELIRERAKDGYPLDHYFVEHVGDMHWRWLLEQTGVEALWLRRFLEKMNWVAQKAELSSREGDTANAYFEEIAKTTAPDPAKLRLFDGLTADFRGGGSSGLFPPPR